MMMMIVMMISDVYDGDSDDDDDDDDDHDHDDDDDSYVALTIAQK